MLTLLAGFLVTINRQAPAIKRIDRAFSGWVFDNLALDSDAADDVLIISIDEESITLAGGWPWQPLDYALFLNAAREGNASVTAVDHPLAWSDPDTPYLDLLVNTAYRTRNLVLPYVATTSGENPPATATEDIPRSHLDSPAANTARLPRLTPTQTSMPELLPAARAGFIPPPASQSPVSHASLVAMLDGQMVPSLALEAWRLHVRAPLREVRPLPGSLLEWNDRPVVPMNPEGECVVDFRHLDAIDQIPYRELLTALDDRGNSQNQENPGLARLDEALVIMGRTTPNARTLTTPWGRRISPCEFLATTMATLLSGHSPRPAPLTVWLLICAAFTLPAILLTHLRPAAFLRLLVVFLCLYLAAALSALHHAWTLLPASLPLACTLLLLLVRLLRGRDP